MRTTFILEVDPDLVDFIHRQNMEDPSALVNQVLRVEKKKQGLASKAAGNAEKYDSDLRVAMEEYLDDSTPAAD